MRESGRVVRLPSCCQHAGRYCGCFGWPRDVLVLGAAVLLLESYMTRHESHVVDLWDCGVRSSGVTVLLGARPCLGGEATCHYRAARDFQRSHENEPSARMHVARSAPSDNQIRYGRMSSGQFVIERHASPYAIRQYKRDALLEIAAWFLLSDHVQPLLLRPSVLGNLLLPSSYSDRSATCRNSSLRSRPR